MLLYCIQAIIIWYFLCGTITSFHALLILMIKFDKRIITFLDWFLTILLLRHQFKITKSVIIKNIIDMINYFQICNQSLIALPNKSVNINNFSFRISMFPYITQKISIFVNTSLNYYFLKKRLIICPFASVANES